MLNETLRNSSVSDPHMRKSADPPGSENDRGGLIQIWQGKTSTTKNELLAWGDSLAKPISRRMDQKSRPPFEGFRVDEARISSSEEENAVLTFS